MLHRAPCLLLLLMDCSALWSRSVLRKPCYCPGILNKLEQVRQLFESKGLDADEADEMFEDIDDSLDDLRDLCHAKTLKSKFRQAGQQLIIAKRLSKAGQEQTRKRLVPRILLRNVLAGTGRLHDERASM